MVMLNGIPALRHDWVWPQDRAGLIQHFAQLGSGWAGDGLGHSNPYPMSYLMVWPLALCALLFGSLATLAVQLVAIAATAWFAGKALASRFGRPWGDGALIAIFLLFNPWTYGKIVSGHFTQTMACMAFTVVLTESLQRAPDRRRLLAAVIVTALQTQFFLIALALCLIRSARVEARIAAIAGLLVFSPTIIGIIANAGELLTLWPFTVAFEDDQSVLLRDGVLLRGDFTHYAIHPFDGIAMAGVAVVVCICLFAVLVHRTRSTYTVALIAVTALLAASGTKGVIGPLWRWATIHVSVLGVYRELYDLIGFAACAYAILVAMALGVGRFVRPALGVGCALLAIAWLAYPPTHFFVPAAAIAQPGPALASSSRYALMPPFQPLSYRGSGSGADPLYAGLSFTSAPVNALLSRYPANAALAEYWQKGDVTDLRRLGTDVIQCRSGFSVASGATIYYHVRAARSQVCESGDVAVDHPASMVAFQKEAVTCTLCSAVAAGNRFFGDLAAYKGHFYFVPPLRQFADPKRGWVDARLEFAGMPDLAQPLGGAFTTQSKQPLVLTKAPFALVNVRGELRDEHGTLVAKNTRGYQWVPIAATSVYCTGMCVVAGTGNPPNAPLNGQVQNATPVAYGAPCAWFLSVDLNAGGSGIIRLIETYAPGWVALTYPDMRPLPHLRLDATFNGWSVGQHGTMRIILVNAPTVLQFGAEMLGYIVTLLAFLSCMRGITK